MNTDLLLRRLERAWQDLKGSCAGLAEDDFLRPGVVEEWTLKDLLAHVTTWEEEALKYLPLIIAGGRPPTYKAQYGGIDAFNAATAAAKRDLALAEVLRRFEETHERLTRAVAKLPLSQIERETRARRRLRIDTYAHYQVHTQAIRQWRESLAPWR